MRTRHLEGDKKDWSVILPGIAGGSEEHTSLYVYSEAELPSSVFSLLGVTSTLHAVAGTWHVQRVKRVSVRQVTRPESGVDYGCVCVTPSARYRDAKKRLRLSSTHRRKRHTSSHWDDEVRACHCNCSCTSELRFRVRVSLMRDYLRNCLMHPL